jgi:hypothetical protein
MLSRRDVTMTGHPPANLNSGSRSFLPYALEAIFRVHIPEDTRDVVRGLYLVERNACPS